MPYPRIGRVLLVRGDIVSKRSEKYKGERAQSTTQVLIDILETLEEIRDRR